MAMNEVGKGEKKDPAIAGSRRTYRQAYAEQVALFVQL
jgi:hypothetical protein